MPGGPLSGLKVVELAGLGPAPFGCMVLADLGADVLCVDRTREAPDLVPMERSEPADATNPYDVLSRSRRSACIDLKQPEGVGLVLDLVSTADVLVEGFRPGVAERLGLGPQPCCERNPRLVYGRMTGWGQDGPLAARAGHDIDYAAIGGALHAIGRAGQPPTPPLNVVADFGGGGMLLAVGVLAALWERERGRSGSGSGQVVDAAMVDGVALLMAPFVGARASGFWSDRRGENLLDSGAPFYDCYETSDAKWVAVGAIEPQFFAALVEGLGLADDPAMPAQHDQARWPELRERLAATLRSRTRDHWTELFSDRDACVAPVLDVLEAVDHPHNVARSTFVEVGGVPHPAPAPRFDRTPNPVPRPANRPGYDTDGALAAWGIATERIAALRQAGVVTCIG
jgi:alpha-methylacyl-CoA racemase